MARVKVNKTSKPGKTLPRSTTTTMKKKKDLKPSASFPLLKFGKLLESFMKTGCDEMLKNIDDLISDISKSGLVEVNNTTLHGNILPGSTAIKNKKGFKSSVSFLPLGKVGKQHKAFIITNIDEHKLPKRVPSSLPSGFVVTENISGINKNTNAEQDTSVQPKIKCENENVNVGQGVSSLPKLKCARGMFVNDIYVLRKEFSIIKDEGKEETYFIDEPFYDDDDDLEDAETSRIDELNESWNAAYGDVRDPGTPSRVSFGSAQDIVVDRVRWSKKTLRDARKGPWLKWAFMRKLSGPESWTVSE